MHLKGQLQPQVPMRTRTFRLVCLFSLTCLGIGSSGCPWWRHPVVVVEHRDDRREHREERREEHHEEHHDDRR